MPLTRRQFLQLAALTATSTAATRLDLPRSSRAQTDFPPIIVDGHLDLGWNIVNYGRDYTQSAYDLRGDSKLAGQAMVGLPELQAGRVALIVGTIYVMPSDHVPAHMRASTRAQYSTPDEAAAWGWTELAAIESLAASSKQFRVVISADDLDSVLATWGVKPLEASHLPFALASSKKRANTAPFPLSIVSDRDSDLKRLGWGGEKGVGNERRRLALGGGPHRIGIILAMEGAEPIRDPADLAAWHARGLRSVGLAWSGTRYAGGSYSGGDLTGLGIDLLTEMRRLGMLLDVAHLSEQAFWSALDHWDGPVVYSHGIVRHYLPAERALSDDQVRAVAERGGLVGIAAYNEFFAQNRRGVVPTLDDLVDAIEYVCDLTGSCDHVAIGSDSDGGFGAEMAPIDTVADLQQIPIVLSDRGYSPAQIDAIMHGNWLRIWREVLT